LGAHAGRRVGGDLEEAETVATAGEAFPTSGTPAQQLEVLQELSAQLRGEEWCGGAARRAVVPQFPRIWATSRTRGRA